MGGRLALQTAFSSSDDLDQFDVLATWSAAIQDLDLFRECPVLFDAARVNSRLRLFYVRCENDERYRNYRLDKLNRLFTDGLNDLGIRCNVEYRPGPHSWLYWNEELEVFLPLMPAH